jgi:RimJ/RimL family protein N-acetyltransferase
VFPVSLETKRLYLREQEEGDWPMVHVWESDPAVVRYKSNGVSTLKETKAYVEQVCADARATPRRIYELALVTFEDAQLIGKVGLKLDEKDPRLAVCWFTLRGDAQGQGYAKEAMEELLRFGFEQLKLHRVEGDCDPRNAASARLMERLGMRREGHFVKNIFLQSEWCDSLVYALLEEEWRAARKGP